MIKSCQNSRWHFFAVLWFSIEVDKYKMNSWFECQKVQHTFPLFQGVYPQNIWTNNLLRFGCPIISMQRKISIVNCKYVLIIIFQNYKVSLNNIKGLFFCFCSGLGIGLKAKLEKDCGTSCSVRVCLNDEVAVNVTPKLRPGKILVQAMAMRHLTHL